jgi:Domain of Unknown Function (DUF748)
VAAVLLAGGVLLAWQLALRELQQAVLSALGPRASVESWEIGLDGVVLHGLRIRAERGGPSPWPAEDELRATRVHVQPAWRSLWAGDAGGWRLRRVRIEGGFLSLLRTRQGQLRLLPGVLERYESPVAAGPRAAGGALAARQVLAKAETRPGTGAGREASRATADAPRVTIAEIVLDDAAIDLYDASIARPPHRLQLAALAATVGPLNWPALDQRVPLTVQARLKGLPAAGDSRDGELRLAGEVTPATREAQLSAHLRSIDLRVLQPYLLRVNEGGVERGFVDLDLDATVRGQHLHAPGRVVFSGLQLAARPGVLGSFAGLPQQLVLAAVRDRGRIELKFTLDGRLDDPAFSLNENLVTRIGVGLAQSLGVSAGGVVEGLGRVIKGLFGK